MAVDYYPSVKFKFLRPWGYSGNLTKTKPVFNDQGGKIYRVIVVVFFVFLAPGQC